MMRSMLTTIDNPYDPFENFKEWYAFDEQAGYHTTGYLARLTFSSEELSEADQLLATEEAIDDIVNENVLGVYKKITKNFPDVSTSRE